jgi:DNA-binding NarL/FixJ family response regulator
MEPIRVLIVDDHLLFRRGLSAILSRVDGLTVIGEAGDGLEGLRLARAHKPNVVLMDAEMPLMDGVTATGIIRQELEETRVVILSMHEADEYTLAAIRMGASGYILKEDPPEDLVRAIRAAAAGKAVLNPSVAVRVLREFRRAGHGPAEPEIASLTARERELLGLVARGYRNREIAEILCLSLSTVKAHLRSIFRKLHATSRSHVILLTQTAGTLVSAPDKSW